MTKDEAIKQLNEMKAGTDNEAAHSEADFILIQFLDTIGHEELTEAFVQARDRVGFWYA